jgi:hypothetical protein
VLSKFVPRGGDRVYSSPKGKEKEREGCMAGIVGYNWAFAGGKSSRYIGE